jgi:hypothetical protein
VRQLRGGVVAVAPGAGAAGPAAARLADYRRAAAFGVAWADRNPSRASSHQ